MDAESQARMLRATADGFAGRIENGDDVVAVFAAPGEASLVTWNHSPMDVTVMGANAFLAAAFGEGLTVSGPRGPRDIARSAIEAFARLSNPGLPGIVDVLHPDVVDQAVDEAVLGGEARE